MAFYNRYDGDEIYDEKQRANRGFAYKCAFFSSFVMSSIVVPVLSRYIPINLGNACGIITIIPALVFVLVAIWKNAVNGRGKEPVTDIFKYLLILGTVLTVSLLICLSVGAIDFIINGNMTIAFYGLVLGIGSIFVSINYYLKRLVDKLRSENDNDDY